MSMKDLCLVYTNSDTQGRLGTHEFDLVLPPLGLAYLASALEEAGRTVSILDASAERLSLPETLHRLRGRYRIVGFYCHTQNFPLIVEMTAGLKASPDAPFVIIGGPHATAMPVECMEVAPQIDALVFGEGEKTIIELVARMLEDRPLDGMAGANVREKGRLRLGPPREQIEDLDALPMPAWHLLPMKLYRSFIESGGRRALHIIGSRGCFSDCNYCHSTKMWGPRVRWHSPSRVLREMDHLRDNYGVEFYQFFDDIFTLDSARLKILMPAFRERGLKNRWCCSTRIDLLNEEVVRDLKLGGASHVAIGMETVNDRLLGVINKKVTKKQTVEALRLCDKHGLRVLGMFILGIPGETREEALETVDFVRRSNLYLAIFSFMTVYPGTNFWKELRHSPRLDKDFSRYSLSKNFTYVEEGRSPGELNAVMRRAYLGFYSRPRVVLHLANLLLSNPARLPGAAAGFARALRGLIRPKKTASPALRHA